MDLQSPKDYWDKVAAEKQFHHPLRIDWLASNLAGKDILDCGCGYGRLLGELAKSGYRDTVGTDFSRGMLKRCAEMHPDVTLRLVRTHSRMLPFREESFDAVLLFTLLTCMPGDGDQRSLLAEVSRVLRPGGLIYISDLLLNSDGRSIERYRSDAGAFDAYGVFTLPEGVTVRHHSESWIREITSGYTEVKYEKFRVTTMNGNQSAAFQYLGRISKGNE
jgi:ubiquinone/menaquinone biosynthesis C-methylase UbiE